jgi:hypothetical protein
LCGYTELNEEHWGGFVRKKLCSNPTKLTLLVSFKTPAPPDAKLTPLRNIEEFPVKLPMERYAGGVATLRLPAAINGKVEAKEQTKR